MIWQFPNDPYMLVVDVQCSWRTENDSVAPSSVYADATLSSSATAHSFRSWMQQKDRVSGPSGDFSNDKVNFPRISSADASYSKREGAKDVASASRCITPPIIDVDSYVPVAPTAQGMAKDTNLDAFMNTAFTRGALSSVSSGNSADERAPFEKKHTKMKFRDIEEPEYQSDVLLNAKKPSPAEGVRGSKRRRAAEVHNLSERRRRDRINQKLQTLQELIPNSNKADKASLLDEVIEYLKNLKHQVQMMSTASSFCVPPLMFTPGTRHVYHAPTPHCPVFSVPSIHGAHYPTPMGLINFPGPPGPILPMCGHSSPVLHRSVPGAHLVPVTGWPQAWATRPGASPAMNDEDLTMKKNSQRVMNKLQATNDVSNGSR